MKLAALILGFALAGCAPSDPPSRMPDQSAAPVRCEPAPEVPAGFEVLSTIEDPYADHIGVRVSLADAGGRELHLFSGIPGEFGEGLPVVATPDVGSVEGRLQGAGTVWVLTWTEQGACGGRAVLGNGFGRAAFIELLQEVGLVRKD